jgi:hypothetical protein
METGEVKSSHHIVSSKDSKRNTLGIVGSEVLRALVMKSIIFWDTTSCSPLKVNDVSEKHTASIFKNEE